MYRFGAYRLSYPTYSHGGARAKKDIYLPTQSSSFSTTLALLAMEATDEATEDTREMPETNVELRPIVVKPKY